MKTIEEIDAKLSEYSNPRALSYQKLVIQALKWAKARMKHNPPEAEDLILKRIIVLEEMQGKVEVMGFATKPARATQINALKWVVDKYDIDHLDPLY